MVFRRSDPRCGGENTTRPCGRTDWESAWALARPMMLHCGNTSRLHRLRRRRRPGAYGMLTHRKTISSAMFSPRTLIRGQSHGIQISTRRRLMRHGITTRASNGGVDWKRKGPLACHRDGPDGRNQHMNHTFDAADVKQAARGQWPAILQSLGGLTAEQLNPQKARPLPAMRRHRPIPGIR